MFVWLTCSSGYGSLSLVKEFTKSANLTVLPQNMREGIYAEVGRRIRERRREKKMTQNMLGSAISLGRTSVANIERGRQKLLLHTLLEIALALEVDPSELIPVTNQVSDSDGLVDFVRQYEGPGRAWVAKAVRRSHKEPK